MPELIITDPTLGEYQGPDGKYRNPLFPDSKLSADLIWNFFAPEVRAMRKMRLSDRFTYAMNLVAKGFIVPLHIAVFNIEPVTFVNDCFNQGFRWYPAMGQPNVYPQASSTITPGPGDSQVVYDADHAPRASFPISLDAGAYPPFDPPAPVTVSPATPLRIVGNAMGFGFYGRGVDAHPDNVTNGAEFVADDGKTVIAHVQGAASAMVGWTCYFTAK